MVLRTIFTLSIKKEAKSFTSRFLFELFSRFAYLSVSLTSSSSPPPLPSLPPSSSLLASPARSREQARGASEQAARCPVPPRLVFFFFSEAWIKVAFRAAIVRVIRKSYLQRVRVASEETARGMGDEAPACVCVVGREVGLGRAEIFFFLSPSNAWNYTCHLPVRTVWACGSVGFVCVRVITHFHVCACAWPHTSASM